MSLRKVLGTAALVFMVTGAAPAKASADWLFTPFVGINWGGSAKFNELGVSFDDKFKRKVDYGASLAWMGAGILGFEFDFGYSPNFFEETSTEPNFGHPDSNVTTFIGNIRTRIDDADAFFDISSNDLGINVGGGVHLFMTDKVGFRGDVRYFRSLKDDDPGVDDIDFSLGSFNYWRGTI